MFRNTSLHTNSLLLLLTASLVWFAGCAHPEPKKKSDGSDARQIYDMSADGEVALAAALAEAAAADKRVLLSLGANWCSDSQNTYDLLQNDPTIRDLVEKHYILTMVDANRRVGYQRNPTIIDRYQVPLDRGIPILLVLAPNGDLLTPDASTWPEDSDHKHPERIRTYLENSAAQ